MSETLKSCKEEPVPRTKFGKYFTTDVLKESPKFAGSVGHIVDAAFGGLRRGASNR